MPLGDFSPQAAAYARARPGYPPALIAELIQYAGVHAGDPVVDLAAGTGLLTAMLAEHGFAITAIEPNAAMRQQAAVLPKVRWTDGTFERTGLPDASQRWAVSAQAFHWAKPAEALPEIKRILAPGGHFTILWNDREEHEQPVLVWTRQAIQRHLPEFEQTYRGIGWADVLASTGDFKDVVRHEARHVVPMSKQRYLDLWQSHNLLAHTAGPERLAAFLTELTQYVQSLDNDKIDVPYLCQAWTGRRT